MAARTGGAPHLAFVQAVALQLAAAQQRIVELESDVNRMGDEKAALEVGFAVDANAWLRSPASCGCAGIEAGSHRGVLHQERGHARARHADHRQRGGSCGAHAAGRAGSAGRAGRVAGVPHLVACRRLQSSAGVKRHLTDGEIRVACELSREHCPPFLALCNVTASSAPRRCLRAVSSCRLQRTRPRI